SRAHRGLARARPGAPRRQRGGAGRRGSGRAGWLPLLPLAAGARDHRPGGRRVGGRDGGAGRRRGGGAARAGGRDPRLGRDAGGAAAGFPARLPRRSPGEPDGRRGLSPPSGSALLTVPRESVRRTMTRAPGRGFYVLLSTRLLETAVSGRVAGRVSDGLSDGPRGASALGG